MIHGEGAKQLVCLFDKSASDSGERLRAQIILLITVTRARHSSTWNEIVRCKRLELPESDGRHKMEDKKSQKPLADKIITHKNADESGPTSFPCIISVFREISARILCLEVVFP